MPAAYTNGYRPFPFNNFSGGLNLRDKADVVGDREAIDLLNVEFTERGAVRQRDGYEDLTTADLTNRVDSLSPYYNAAGARQLIAGCGTRLEALNASGGALASLTGLTGGPWQFVRFGDLTHENLYAANASNPAARWDGANWTAGTALATVDGVAGRAMPKAGSLAVTAALPGTTSGSNAANRLIATAFGTQTTAGPGGAPSSPSRVYFSNPGAPEVWETDGSAGPPVRGRNYLDLTPGDGERIMAAVTWRELVFIFKETKFFILWGEGTASDGTPTFQVREVVNSIGLASPQAVAVGRDGVYFMNRRGVYRTSGGDPVLLSDVIAPMWMQDPEAYFRSSSINLARLDLCRLLWHMERVYLAVPTGGATDNDRVLVYDTQHQWWSLYDVPASALASFRSSARPEVHVGYASPLPQRVGHQILGYTTDRGNRMVSRWRSGWGDYDSSEIKTLREAKAWGDGTAIVAFSVDFNIDAQVHLPAPFRLGGLAWTYTRLTDRGGSYGDLSAGYNTYADLSGNQPLRAVVNVVPLRYAVRGTVFSTEFSNGDASGSSFWALHRIVRHMREVREPSVVH